MVTLFRILTGDYVFDSRPVFILVAAVCYAWFLRTGNVKDLGCWGRWATMWAGLWLFCYTAGYLNLFGNSYWIVIGIVIMVAMMMDSWVEGRQAKEKPVEEAPPVPIKSRAAELDGKAENSVLK